MNRTIARIKLYEKDSTRPVTEMSHQTKQQINPNLEHNATSKDYRVKRFQK
jgi:hypothetical protein